VAFAVGETIGGVSGRDLIAAIAIAIDIQVRLNKAIPDLEWPMTEGWFSSQLLGFFSGTAVAGRLLALNEDQMVSAFGIAFNQACGSREMASGVSTHLRGMQGGFSGQSSVLAALLAQRGLIGSENSIEGRYGLYKTYVRVKPNREALIDKLGADFPMLKVHGYKAWPACQFTHSPIQSVQNLRQRYGIRPQDVEEAVIIGGSMHTQLLSEPPESKQNPKTSMDAKYSIPFTVAAALATDNVTLKTYTQEGLKDKAVLEMAKRVRYQPLPEEKKTSHIPIIEIHTRDGKVYSDQAEFPLGRAQNPLSQKQLENKFLDCVSFSAKKIPRANIERTIELIRDLEKAPDATEVIRLLA
jgi:2-methylcitrate dehydratase PrpD